MASVKTRFNWRLHPSLSKWISIFANPVTDNTSEFDPEAVFLKLSLGNKIKLLTGLGWWHTESIPEAGINSMRFSDGPNRLRGTRFFNGVRSSCFPCSTGLGSSFDVDLAYEIGQALGEEAQAKSCHLLLAPTVNIQRSPLGGRSFEFFAEDPHLNGFLASAYINGVQSKGVGATIKHFVANDQETERFSISSEVSERALREIYLKPFQIAIKQANPWALMSAYNRINGVHVSDSQYFLDDILRKEWGFQGMIMSDWNGIYSTSTSIKAGVDLEMPGPTVMRGKAIERALTSQKLFPADIDDRVKKLLGLLKRAHESGIPFDGPEEYLNTPEIAVTLRKAAAESIVLLKNDKGILPLTDRYKRIAVIGPNARIGAPSGGGSARLRSSYTISPLKGITEAAKTLGIKVDYSPGAEPYKFLPTIGEHLRWDSPDKPPILVEFWNEPPSANFLETTKLSDDLLDAPVWTTLTHDTDCFLVDGINEAKVNLACWTRYSWIFKPNFDGDWEFELNLAGRGNLFFNGELAIDLSTNPPLGGSAFGLGTENVRATVPDLQAGASYRMEIRMSSEDFVARGPPFPCWGSIRLGGKALVDPRVTINRALELARVSDVVVLVIGLDNDWETEGHDRETLNLPGYTNELVTGVLDFHDNVVIVNQSGSAVTMPWAHKASTILQAFYGGDELGNGLADVLLGIVNPSAKLPLTFPVRLEDVPSYTSFGSNVQEPGKVLYNEGIFVGYRGYEAKNTEPLFPFGFGLSYTTFNYGDLSLSLVSEDGAFTVSFTVTNTGKYDGKEVVQIYISDPESSQPRPLKELKAFTKVQVNVGETKAVKISLTKEALGFYDTRRVSWVAEKGRFTVLVGTSSSNLVLRGDVELEKTIVWTGL